MRDGASTTATVLAGIFTLGLIGRRYITGQNEEAERQQQAELRAAKEEAAAAKAKSEAAEKLLQQQAEAEKQQKMEAELRAAKEEAAAAKAKFEVAEKLLQQQAEAKLKAEEETKLKAEEETKLKSEEEAKAAEEPEASKDQDFIKKVRSYLDEKLSQLDAFIKDDLLSDSSSNSEIIEENLDKAAALNEIEAEKKNISSEIDKYIELLKHNNESLSLLQGDVLKIKDTLLTMKSILMIALEKTLKPIAMKAFIAGLTRHNDKAENALKKVVKGHARFKRLLGNKISDQVTNDLKTDISKIFSIKENKRYANLYGILEFYKLSVIRNLFTNMNKYSPLLPELCYKGMQDKSMEILSYEEKKVEDSENKSTKSGQDKSHQSYESTMTVGPVNIDNDLLNNDSDNFLEGISESIDNEIKSYFSTR